MASIQRFLPKTSRIVIQQKGKPAQWYETKEDVVLENVTTATCPLTNEEVQTTTAQGVKVWFQQRQTRTRVVLEQGDVDPKLLNEPLSVITYDVPVYGDSAGFSPCDQLRQYAVPLTKSEWLVRTGDMPYNFIAEMENIGVIVEYKKLDISETRRQTEKSIGFMIESLNGLIARAEKSMADAQTKLDNSEQDGVSEEEALRVYRRDISNIQTRLKKWQDATVKGITTFGIRGQSFNLDRLGERAQCIRKSMSTRAQAYSRGAQALAAVGTTDATTLAQLAQADQLPAMVLAGALEDNGLEAEAQAVVQSFSEEDDTFPLA